VPNKEARIKFTAETSEFQAQIKGANSALASFRAGLALNEAEFKNTGNSAQYLQNKQKLLSAEIKSSQQKQEALNGKLEAAKRIYGENSTEAQGWATSLDKAKAEEQKLLTALNETNDAIEKQRQAEEDAKQPIDQLKVTIEQQRAELERLRSEYANVALTEGKNSESAKDLKVRINELNDELNRNEKELKDVSLASNNSKEALGGMSKGCIAAGNILGNLASQGLSFLIQKLKEAVVAVINLGTEFTASLSRVQALSGATSGEMAALEERAKELGRSTIFSATDVSDAFGYMALAGWDVSDMLSGIDGVLNLAASSEMDLAKASDIVTDYLTAFGLSAADSGKFVDQMTYAMSHSNTNTEQLGEAYKNVASTAASLGYSVEDTTSAIMVLANAGVKGGEAGTGLSTIMTRLATNAKDSATALHKHGVEVYDSSGKMNSLSSILLGTAKAWTNMSDKERAALAKTVAGTSQYSKFASIMGQLSSATADGTTQFEDYTEALENCKGTASEMSQVMNDNLSGDMKALGSAMEGLGLELFSIFEGPLRGIAQLTTEVVNDITDGIEGIVENVTAKSDLQNFIDDIAKSTEAIQDSIKNTKDAVDGANTSVAELEAYKGILLELNSQEELSEFQKYQMKAAVEALSGVMPELASSYDEVTGSLNLTNEELVKMFDNTEALIMQQALSDARTEMMKNVIDAQLQQTKAESALAEASKEYAEAYNATNAPFEGDPWMEADYYTSVAADAEVARQNMQAAIKVTEDATKATKDAEDEYKLLEETAAQVAEQYGEMTGGAKEAAEGQKDVTDATEEATDALEDNEESIWDQEDAYAKQAAAAEAAAERIKQAFEDQKKSISDSAAESVSLLKAFDGGVEITADEIYTNLVSQYQQLSTWMGNMQLLATQVGEGMTQEVYDAILEMGPGAANLVQTLVDTMNDGSGQFEEIVALYDKNLQITAATETLAAYTQAGKDYAAAAEAGLSDGEEDITTAAQDIGDAAAEESDFSGVSEKASEAAEGVSDSMTSIANDVRAKMNTAVAATYSGVDQMRRALTQTLRGPNIILPHFYMAGAFDARTGAVPTVGVNWYAKGGIFTKPTIFDTAAGQIGVGEAGAEAVLPIDLLREYIADAIDRPAYGDVNIEMTVNGAEDPEAWGSKFGRALKSYMRMV